MSVYARLSTALTALQDGAGNIGRFADFGVSDKGTDIFNASLG